MEAFTKGEIVLYPFPYTDFSNSKLRPCLLLSNKIQSEYVLCQITSQFSGRDKYVVALDKKNTLSGSLMIDSYIRCNMVFTGHERFVVRRICKVRQETYNKVIKKIISIIS